MTFPVRNLSSLNERNYFLTVKKQNNEEYLTVEKKGFFGRIWRNLGFGNASIAKVFNFLNREKETFNFSNNSARSYDMEFVKAVYKYVSYNPKVCAKLAKTNTLVHDLLFINTAAPKYNDDDTFSDYALLPSDYYKKFIEPLTHVQVIPESQEKIKQLASRYYMFYRFNEPVGRVIEFKNLVANSPELAKYVSLDQFFLAVDFERDEILKIIVSSFPSIRDFSLSELTKEKLEILKNYQGSVRIRNLLNQDAVTALSGFKNEKLVLNLPLVNLVKFPEIELEGLNLELNNLPGKDELYDLCDHVKSSKLKINCEGIETHQAQFQHSLYKVSGFSQAASLKLDRIGPSL